MADYDSEYTVATVYQDFPDGAQVDIQVEALIGNPTYSPIVNVFDGETSGWSETQTITISGSQTPTPSPATTPTPTPYEEPQQTEQEIIIGAAIVAAVIGAGLGLLIYLIKRKISKKKKC